MRSEQGFTIVEVMMAALIVAIGLFGALGMLDLSARESVSVKARAGGLTLQREVMETARSLPYDRLLPTSVVAQVQSRPGMADSSPSGGWTVERRGITYTVSANACAVDDAQDGTGTHDPSLFCPPADSRATPTECARLVQRLADGLSISATDPLGPCGIDADLDGATDGFVEATAGICLLNGCTSTGTSDKTPADLKRITVQVRWETGSGRRFLVQHATVPSPGASSGPAVTALTSSETSTAVSFTATTSRKPAAVSWSVDGQPKGTASGTDTTWTFSWDTSSVLDGTYLVTARATDEHGVSGTTRTATVTLNRNAPTAPPNFKAGLNGPIVDLDWSRSPEGDLEGYRVYRLDALGQRTQVCGLADRTECIDQSPDATQTRYELVAVDRTAAGALREGAPSTSTIVTDNVAPFPPSSLTATASGSDVVLQWVAPNPQDPDTGDAVAFYRIYRKGPDGLVDYADRYGRTGAGSEVTFTDTNVPATGGPYRYWVTSVDGRLAESVRVGPVSP